MRFIILTIIYVITCSCKAQVHYFPYKENFDTVSVPELPSGWSSTTFRSAAGDFTTVSSYSFSDSNAVISTNARIEQHLYSPVLDFSDKSADSLTFWERRSGSHDSDLLIEASCNELSGDSIRLGDTLRNSGTTMYIYRSIKIPPELSGQAAVRLRWRVIGNGTGTTGTLRFDDIFISAIPKADAAAVGITVEPPLPISGSSVWIGGIIKNAGLTPLASIKVNLFHDLNSDDYADPSELLIEDILSQPLAPGDSAIVRYFFPEISSGSHNIILRCYHPDDLNPMNDYYKYRLNIVFPEMAVVINEIMYAPLPGNSEYVELFNTQQNDIDISEWRITDKPEREQWSASDVINGTKTVIPANDFLIAANDSSVYDQFPYLRDSNFTVIIRKANFTLNNEGDNIILADRSGRIIDSIYYFPLWHNPYIDDCTGRSLERVNPGLKGNDNRNWSTCADHWGGTPGVKNSIFTNFFGGNSSISASPNPFSPDGDGYEDFTVLRYNLSGDASMIRLRVFDSQGRLIRTLAHGDPSGPQGELIWDGYNEKRQRVPIGIYIIFLETLDNSGTPFRSFKSVVVVATKL